MKYMTVQRLKALAVLLVIGLLVVLIQNNNCPASLNEDQNKMKSEEEADKLGESNTEIMTPYIKQLSSQMELLKSKNNQYENEVERLNEEIQNLMKKSLPTNNDEKVNEVSPVSGSMLKSVDVANVMENELSKTDINYNTYTTSFEDTLRNCLGQHCFDQKPDGSTFETVGLLAPPNSAGDDIIQAISKSGGSVQSSSVHLEYNTHVPAYGYGKNHGWSRIIRLVR